MGDSFLAASARRGQAAELGLKKAGPTHAQGRHFRGHSGKSVAGHYFRVDQLIGMEAHWRTAEV
jgi:hypothetical protein